MGVNKGFYLSGVINIVVLKTYQFIYPSRSFNDRKTTRNPERLPTCTQKGDGCLMRFAGSRGSFLLRLPHRNVFS